MALEEQPRGQTNRQPGADDQLLRQHRMLLTLYQITLYLLNRRSLDDLLHEIVARATELLDAPYGEIMLLEGDELVVRAFTPNQPYLVGDRAGPAEALLSWQAVRTRMPALLDDYSAWSNHRTLYDGASLGAVLDLPILHGERCLGVLGIARERSGAPFDEQELRVGVLFAQLAALALDHAQLYEAALAELEERRRVEQALRESNAQLTLQLAKVESLQAALREQAVRDQLTGVYNRRYLIETLQGELARAQRQGYQVSLVLIDIDHFKRFNDTYGHSAGDQVLRAVGAQLAQQTRAEDVVCRYGGEEFVVALHNTAPEVAFERAEQLRLAIGDLRVPYEQHELHVTISAGVAAFPGHGATFEQVIHAADQALYAAKAAGRDQVQM
jgi:diguanylate cyclase (GGDEF)-like protein